MMTFAKVENDYDSICSLFEELLKIYTLYEINNKISKIGIDDYIGFCILLLINMNEKNFQK